MEEALYTGQIPVQNFSRLITDCGFLPDAYVLVEQLPAHANIRKAERLNLVSFRHLEQNIPIDYASGRVFDEQAELRWEKQGSTMQVVYLGTQARTHALPGYQLKESAALSKLQPNEGKKYFLFGQRLRSSDLEKIGPAAQPGDFAEVRIPRILRYPLQQNEQQYAYLVVREYLDEEGRVVLFRFQNLKSWSSQL